MMRFHSHLFSTFVVVGVAGASPLSGSEICFAGSPEVHVALVQRQASQVASSPPGTPPGGDDAKTSELDEKDAKGAWYTALIDDFSAFNSSIWSTEPDCFNYSSGTLSASGTSCFTRSVAAYDMAGGAILTGSFFKAAMCETHFVTISTNPDLKPNLFATPGAITFGNSCNTMVLYGSSDTDSVQCTVSGAKTLNITVDSAGATFSNTCGSLRVGDALASTPVYIYMGGIYHGSPSVANSRGALWYDLSLKLPLTPSTTPPPLGELNPSASGDPHLVNIRGERFDIYKVGQVEFLRVPYQSRKELANFTALATIQDVANSTSRCEESRYITSMLFGGAWLGDLPVKVSMDHGHMSVLHGDVQMKPSIQPFSLGGTVQAHLLDETRLELQIGAASITISCDIRPVHFFLNVQATALGKLGYRIGGLLGEDSNADVSTPPAECRNQFLLRTSSETQRSVASATM